MQTITYKLIVACDVTLCIFALVSAEKLFWTDGSAVGYTNWENGEPSGADGELCTEMIHYNGKWNDQICAQKDMRGYVCKTPQSTLPFTSTCFVLTVCF